MHIFLINASFLYSTSAPVLKIVGSTNPSDILQTASCPDIWQSHVELALTCRTWVNLAWGLLLEFFGHKSSTYREKDDSTPDFERFESGRIKLTLLRCNVLHADWTFSHFAAFNLSLCSLFKSHSVVTEVSQNRLPNSVRLV